MSTSVKKVAVIGAGVAGLIAARELKREGHEVIVYEKQSTIGGTWVYDPQVDSDPLGIDPNRTIVHSSIYLSLRTNLPRDLMCFSDYPFVVRENVGDSRNFPGHEEVLEYLKSFAVELRLVELIRFNDEVVRVEQQQQVDDSDFGDQWIVESRNALEVFDAVVVCNGHFTQPRIANLPGSENWPGKQIHSHNYRVPEPFQGQVVIIIGAGRSASDISREIASVAKQVHLSSRSPDVKFSKLSAYSNIYQHSKIESVHEDGKVTFQDGYSIRADVIIHCTGYNYDFPFLKTNGIVKIDDNRVGLLYKHVFPPQLSPTLSFVGIPARAVLFHMFELQSKWIAFVLSGKVLLPSKEKMMVDVNVHYNQMLELGYPKHHTHSLNPFELDYMDWLAAEVRCPPLDDRLKDMFRQLYMLFRSENVDFFRDE